MLKLKFEENSRLTILILGCCLISACHDKKVFTNNNGITDLLVLHHDTLIAAKNDRGIIITTNAGNTWEIVNDNIHLKQLVIDHDGILWGLDYWQGIHEPSYSKLFFSKDLGKTWTPIDLGASEIIATQIVSFPFSPLVVVDSVQKKYRLSGIDFKKQWEYISDSTVDDTLYMLTKSKYLVEISSDTNRDTILKLDNISRLAQVILSNDSLFIVGSGDGGKKSYFASLSRHDTTLHRYATIGQQLLGIRKDVLNRIWLFGDAGIFLKNDDSVQRVYGL